ncbi:hypothetical protein Tco_0645716 [Tanacetum coccineum]
MNDPNITIEEYIRLEEEKARKRAIVFNDALTSEVTPSCEPTISPLNDNKIDFRMLCDESDDEDYTPTVSYFDDLDFFKDFENEFLAIVYNDALTSKLDFLTEPTTVHTAYRTPMDTAYGPVWTFDVSSCSVSGQDVASLGRKGTEWEDTMISRMAGMDLRFEFWQLWSLKV